MHEFFTPVPFLLTEKELRGGKLRPEVILRYAQQAGEQQLHTFSAGENDLAQQNLALLIARSDVTETDAHAAPGNAVDAQVILLGRAGIFFVREIHLSVRGEKLCMVRQFCFAVSDDTHRVLRPEDFLTYVPLLKAVCPTQKVASLAKPVCKEPLPAGTYTVQETDLDRNRHVNNACYLRILQDLLPQNPPHWQIFYIRECKLGDTISLFTENRDGMLFAGGFLNGKTAFLYCTE